MGRYTGFKEVIKMVPLPDKPSAVALIDVEKGNLMDLSQKRIIKTIPFWDGTCSKDGRYGLYAPATGGMEMLDLRTGRVCKTLIPKVAEGIFDVMAVFNATMEYVLYYHSGRKTIRAFRRKDGKMIANFRVQADLKGMETTTDGRSVVLGMGDGSMTTLTIADPENAGIADYLLNDLPSRNPEGGKVERGLDPICKMEWSIPLRTIILSTLTISGPYSSASHRPSPLMMFRITQRSKLQ